MAAYKDLKDRIDGGGPGKSGGAYSGGGALSNVANKLTNNNGTGSSGTSGSSRNVGSNLPGATRPRARGQSDADYQRQLNKDTQGRGATLVAGKDLAFATKNPNTTITEQQYNAGKAVSKVMSIIGGPLGLGVRAITELQRRGILPASANPSQYASSGGGSDTEKRIDAILSDPAQNDAQKNAAINNLLSGEVNAADAMSSVQPLADAVYNRPGAVNPSAVFDSPETFLKGMTLGTQIPTMDPNAPGTVLNPADPRYAVDADGLNVTAAVVSDTAVAPTMAPKPVSTYAAATTFDDVVNKGQATAQQGRVSDAAVINAEQLDAQGTATGMNADGSVNYTGVALNSAKTQGMQIIDTSTVAGRLLAQELGEGNYTDGKATVQGQLDILSKQFVDPATGEPKIPSWASGVARNVSRIAAFKGMTGTAATAAMATAIMEASLPIAAQDAQFFQTLTVTNLNNRQQMAVQKAQVMANLDLANLDARMTAAVENSKAFLAMDLANLDNRQQTEMVNTQARVQSILEDAKAENASRLFAAESQNDFTKFYDNLNTQISQFNAVQTNEMNRFNVGEINNTAQFNATMENQREQFYKEMQYNIDLSNARWRQTVATTNTQMKFEAARTDVQNMVNLSNEAMTRMWDREDALLDYAWKSNDNALDRNVTIYGYDKGFEINSRELDNEESAAKGAGIFELAKTAFDVGDKLNWW
jgi:hypothetical protein